MVSASSWPLRREARKRLGIPEEKGTKVVETAICCSDVTKVLRRSFGFQFRPTSFSFLPAKERTSSLKWRKRNGLSFAVLCY